MEVRLDPFKFHILTFLLGKKNPGGFFTLSFERFKFLRFDLGKNSTFLWKNGSCFPVDKESRNEIKIP